MGRASAEAKNRWNAKNYDRIGVMVPKGRKAEIAAHAAARGESVNGFIGRAITETMERDAQTAFDNQVAEELASELGVTADEIKSAEIFSQAIDVIEARFPGSTKPLLMNRDATSPQDALERVSVSGATPIPSDAKRPSEAVQSGDG